VHKKNRHKKEEATMCNQNFIRTKKNQKEGIIMMKEFLSRGNRKILAMALAVAVLLPGVVPSGTTKAEAATKSEVTAATTEDEALDDFMFSVQKLPSKKGARYEYTYANIPQRNVDTVDGETTLEVEGKTYKLSLKRTVADAAADKNGTVFMRYKNNAGYFASYELEGKSITKHKLMIDGKQVYMTEIRFKGDNPLIATHYVNENGKEVELPDLDYLRKQLGLSTPTPSPTATVAPTPSPTATVAPTPSSTATVAPTPSSTATVAPTPSPTATVAPTPSPTATVASTPSPTPTPNLNISVDKVTETTTTAEMELWLKALKEKTLTWEEFLVLVGKSTWTAEKQYGETTETWTIYDENHNPVYSKTVTTGYENSKGEETTKQEQTTTGEEKEKEKVEANAGAEAEIKKEEHEKTEINVTNNRPVETIPSNVVESNKGIAHVHKSGAKKQWITKDGATRFTATVKNGKMKLRTINGKKVKCVDYILKTQTAFITIKGEHHVAINLKNFKMVRVREKVCEKLRNKKTSFLSYVVLKDGEKINVKNLKVKGGQSGRNVNGVTKVVSIRKLIR